jgi:pyruvate dehydrogenase E2 component (dihydrolipoamide acetyltransferase)
MEEQTMYEFKLPDVGEGIHEAEVLRWLVKAGDKVKLDQPILEVQTDKAIVEIPSPIAGTIAEIRAKEGTMAEVGDVLVVIAGQEETKAAPATPTNGQPSSAAAAPKTSQTQISSAVKSPGLGGPGSRILAAPAVRKLARELEVDLAQVIGSGPAGRILPDDVRQFVEQQAPTPEPKPAISAPALEEEVASVAKPALVARPTGPETIEEEPLQGLRRRIAERMEQAWQIPHVTNFEEIDVTNLIELRQHLKPEVERREVKLTYLPFIIKAVVQALKAFPYFNASLNMAEKKIIHHRYYHIGIATAVSEGLLVPVIRHADQLSTFQLAAELARLGEAAQRRRLGVEELSGSTFTITNFGSFGGHQGTPIINPPEVAILGIGRIQDKPIAVEGQVVIRPMLPLALSFDHRLIDGAAAGQFLDRLMSLLADPKLLFLEMV